MLLQKVVSALMPLSDECESILKEYLQKFNISLRSYNKIIKVARTIADLEEKENIEVDHIMESILFRNTMYLMK